MAPILVRGAAKKRSESSLKNRLLPLETRADGDPEKRLSPALSPLDLTHAQPETLRPDPSLTLLRASPGVASGGEPYFSGVDFRDQITAVLHVHEIHVFALFGDADEFGPEAVEFPFRGILSWLGFVRIWCFLGRFHVLSLTDGSCAELRNTARAKVERLRQASRSPHTVARGATTTCLLPGSPLR